MNDDPGKEVSKWQSVMFAARAYISVTTSAIHIEDLTESGTQMFAVLSAK